MIEKKYVLTETQLQSLLADAMKLCMLQADGVDNWVWYGESRQETKEAYYPGDWEELDEETQHDLSFWDIAGMRIEAGEFQQIFIPEGPFFE